MTTSALVLSGLLIGALASSWEPGRPALQVLVVVLLGATPFVVVLTHFRWQAPRESNVLLAFVTAGASCVLALVLLVVASIYSCGP